jgi:hypothetical protein
MAINVQNKKVLLEIINYARLQAQDTNEIKKLLKICQISGIFFLDLETGSSDLGFYDDMSSVIAAQQKFFARRKTEKMEFATDLPNRG